MLPIVMNDEKYRHESIDTGIVSAFQQFIVIGIDNSFHEYC